MRRGLASPTLTVAAALTGRRLTHNPSRSTVEPENGGYLGDVYSLMQCAAGRGHSEIKIPALAFPVLHGPWTGDQQSQGGWADILTCVARKVHNAYDIRVQIRSCSGGDVGEIGNYIGW